MRISKDVLANRQKMNTQTNLPKSVSSYIETGAPEGQRNQALFSAACQMRDSGMSEDQTTGLLAWRAQADGLTSVEAQNTVKSAFRQPPRQPPTGGTATPRLPNVRFKKAKTHRDALNSRPVAPPDPIESGFERLLMAAFKEGEGVAIGKMVEDEDGSKRPDAGVVLTREEWLAKVRKKGGIERLFTSKAGLFLRVNPMRKGGAGNADVSAFRHVLVEFDSTTGGGRVPKDAQFGAFLHSDMPITAVIDSGNKSLHAWVRVDATNAQEYSERVDEVFQWFEALNLDRANRNPSRYSRCPDAWRTEEGEERRQRLLAVGLGAASWQAWEQHQAAEQLGSPTRLSNLLTYDVGADKNSVLGNRWLCRGGSLLLVGQSGVGKSSLNMQLAIGWALGAAEMTFGIQPVHPLKSLILQAENDEGDLAEVAQGVAAGFALSQDALASANDRLLWHRITTLTGEEFCSALENLVALHKPDLVWIDPLLSFIGDDLSDARVIASFCAERLSSIALRTGCIFVLVHHTGKPPKDKGPLENWTASDLAYSGLGSSALTNWAREVAVLVRQPSEGPPTFSLTLCKRRKRAGLRSIAGEAAESIYIRHSADGRIRWEQCDYERPEKEERPAKKAQGTAKPNVKFRLGRPKVDLPADAMEELYVRLDEALGMEQKGEGRRLILEAAERHGVSEKTISNKIAEIRLRKAGLAMETLGTK